MLCDHLFLCFHQQEKTETSDKPYFQCKPVQILIGVFQFYDKTSADFFFLLFGFRNKPKKNSISINSCFLSRKIIQSFQSACGGGGWYNLENILLFRKLITWIRNTYWYHSAQNIRWKKPLLTAYYKESFLISDQCILSCLYAGFNHHRVVSSHPYKQYSEGLMLAGTPSISIIYYKMLVYDQ